MDIIGAAAERRCRSGSRPPSTFRQLGKRRLSLFIYDMIYNINWYNWYMICFNILQSILPAYQVSSYLFLRCGWGTIKGVSLPQCVSVLRSLFHAEPCWFEARACILAWAKQRQLWQANIRMANRTIARTGNISMGDMETLSAISFWDKHGYPICFWQFIHVYPCLSYSHHVYQQLHTHTLAICLVFVRCCHMLPHAVQAQMHHVVGRLESCKQPNHRWEICRSSWSDPCLGHASLKALDNFDVHTSGHI